MKYLIKKIWPLIILLIIATYAVISKRITWRIFPFLETYFYFVLYVLTSGIIAHLIGETLPRNFVFTKGYFKCAAWENGGKIYDNVLHVSKWKDVMADASKIFPSTSSKSLNMIKDSEKVFSIIEETCVAEITHLCLIVFSVLIVLMPVSNWKWLFFTIYLLANIADIIIQRYNRPRLVRILNRVKK